MEWSGQGLYNLKYGVNAARRRAVIVWSGNDIIGNGVEWPKIV